MPRISEFYGILIYMYYKDHPPAHFHALYQEHEALVEIESGEVLRGGLPNRAIKLVQEWRELHRAEQGPVDLSCAALFEPKFVQSRRGERSLVTPNERAATLSERILARTRRAVALIARQRRCRSLM